MKQLPIHEYKLTVKRKTSTGKGKKFWIINTTSALPPLKNPRIINRIRHETKEEIVNLIVKEEKGDVVGVSNAVY